MKLTLFSFGYYGWGNSTPQLVESADAVERSRGFEPPIFVDLRIQRSVRAPGFNNNAFGMLLGAGRYVWMKSLGNLQIKTRTGPVIQIAEPNAVNDLLDLAIEAAKDRRRLIFFCQCEWPRGNPYGMCHRTKAAILALKAAKRRGLHVEIEAWPGGKPIHHELGVSPQDFHEVVHGRWNLPAAGIPLDKAAGIAWGSTATIFGGDKKLAAVIGPSQFRLGNWRIPLFLTGENYSKRDIQSEAAKVRKAHGFNVMSSQS